MEATIEISLYPLNEDYEPPILEFIERMGAYGTFKVRVNETSTHLAGDFDAIFDALKAEIKHSNQTHGKQVFVMKVLGINLLNDE